MIQLELRGLRLGHVTRRLGSGLGLGGESRRCRRIRGLGLQGSDLSEKAVDLLVDLGKLVAEATFLVDVPAQRKIHGGKGDVDELRPFRLLGDELCRCLAASRSSGDSRLRLRNPILSAMGCGLVEPTAVALVGDLREEDSKNV